MSINVYYLRLNDMRGPCENARIYAAAFSPDKIIKFAELAAADEPYTDGPSEDDYGNSHTYHKVFKKGSILEWCNPPCPSFKQGIVYETVEFATEEDIPKIVNEIIRQDILFLG